MSDSLYNLECNYLVIGAGTAGMSFIDTLITENPSATIILVDRNSNAGGHWTKAYPFVKLHQPSCNYGVNSLRLGKVSDSKGREAFDIHDRATGAEIVEYYDKIIEKFKDTGRFKCFFDAEFKEKNGMYNIVDKNSCIIHVKCDKLVMIWTKVVVPSMRGPLFPIDDNVNYVSVNGLEEGVQSSKYKKYVVIGAGKTGSDAVIELLRNGIPQSDIKWVISRDVWYILRDGLFDTDNYWKCAEKLFKPLIKEKSVERVILSLEKNGCIGRLQPDGTFPRIFKGPTMDKNEIDLLRSIEDVMRLGRVTSIDSSVITFERGTINYDMKDTLFIDCAVDKLYGYEEFPENFKFFESNRINLGPTLAFFNPSLSSALLAYLETTFNNDEIKNKFCFPLVGDYMVSVTDTFLGAVYAQSKLMMALSCYPPAMKFLLNSRTNADAPMHHGGMLKLLWALYGPMQMRKYSTQLVEKVESLSYSDINHTFGIGRSHKIDSKEIKASLSGKQKGENKNVVSLSKAKKSKGFACCKSIEAVITPK